MASTMSKRQQARNERMLQDLIRSVPGNDRCADCAAKNPAWASWNLGIFLCMRCAAIHRKLGTHISKVKSLSMDSWAAEQVDNMKKMGNVASNKTYNPQNVQPEIPIDVDEVDLAVEKYIRQKYEQRALSSGARPNPGTARQNTGSTETGSWNDEGPPLPPKPGKKFGFSLRSSSSTLPRNNVERFTPPLSPAYTGNDNTASPKKSMKPTHLFGMRITTIENNFDAKLTTLHDMGFQDSKKNTDVLKSMNGNLEKTIEALTRLGEGVKPASRTYASAPRALTPVSMGSTGASGITLERRQEPERKAATNPWEIREEPTPSAAQQAVLQEPPRSRSVPPAATSWNPFLTQNAPPLPQQSLDLSFQNLNISQPSQQYSNQQAQYQAPQPISSNPWQTQPIQQQQQSASPFGQQFQQSPLAMQQPQVSNPFFHQMQSQSSSPSNPWASQLPQQQASSAQQSNNPFNAPWQAQTAFQQPASTSQTPLNGAQPSMFSPPQPAYQQPAPAPQMPQQPLFGASQNPWSQHTSPQPTGLQQQYGQQQPQQPFPMQQQQQFSQQIPVRHDKTSILALYNHPQYAPQQQQQTSLQPLPENGTFGVQPAAAVPQRSATMPAQMLGGGSMNPFMNAPAPPPTTQSIHHVSNESIDFQGFAGSGRHSPDAFSGLSARYMR